MNYYVYILYSAKLDRYYTGSCEDITIRLNQHNTGRNKSTRVEMILRLNILSAGSITTIIAGCILLNRPEN